MSYVTISRGNVVIKARSITRKLLEEIEVLYNLPQSIVGVKTVTPCPYHELHQWGSECTCEYYCQLHRINVPAGAQVQELTLEQGFKCTASCNVCQSCMFIPPDFPEWDTLRDRRASENYSLIEIFKGVIIPHGSYDCIQYQRLVPGSTQPEIMFEKGSYDFKDAARDRRDMWPNAVEVPPRNFDRELELRLNPRPGVRTRVPVCMALENSTHYCGTLSYSTCDQCHRPLCDEHVEEYTHPQGEKSTYCPACREVMRRQYGQ